MQTFKVAHKRPVYGHREALPIGAWTVVAESWRAALDEAHQGIPFMEEGDFLVWLS